MTPEDLLARLLYRDALMLVIDKPAGLPVHAGPGGGETLDGHFDALRFGLPRPPALAHRLDRDTSGCLVLGRHRRATAELGALFARQRIEKTYLAVVCGRLEPDEGAIDAPLAKVSHDRRSWWMKVDPAGQPALTGFRVIARGERLTVVDLMPRTGRTHQLRVHMAHLGHPIVGDGVYGGDLARGVDHHLHLHARRVVVPLYRKKPPVAVEAPMPSHMMRLLTRLDALDKTGRLKAPTGSAGVPGAEANASPAVTPAGS
ncbi:MAG TPA: RNA pseudouridine synthase [Methylomirabilota bacterium]|nr:RNA pseudouridine synthase [Methylomirabilota bacterium]